MTIFKTLHAPHTCSRNDLFLLKWGRPSSHISVQIWPVARRVHPHVPRPQIKTGPGLQDKHATNNRTAKPILRNIPQLMHYAYTVIKTISGPNKLILRRTRQFIEYSGLLHWKYIFKHTHFWIFRVSECHNIYYALKRQHHQTMFQIIPCLMSMKAQDRWSISASELYMKGLYMECMCH